MNEPMDEAAIESLELADRERARRLTLRYTLTATAIFLLAGLMGVALRDSQADLGRLSASAFYALMTAHGLGAFLGWAGFACMGSSYWLLASLGFPLRRLGSALAEAAYWLMVVGVLGVVVSALALRFGGSWVFLYPLPFHSAGQWSESTTGLFSAAVLLVGLAIIAWCVAVLDTVLGPALHAVRGSLANRLGVAIGLGYLWPRRFATNPRPVPYPVIPLAVIGVDMIIATLPLAALLVEMLVQAADPSVTVDPLLAKNVLWWFGHPVVYLLLFPAVALYYHLIPRYAGRPLVTGPVIAVAWAIAVVANVLIWAHHIYLDYPVGSPQAAINISMEPMTYAITIVSALSLFSLLATVFRSRFTWNAASTALFLGIVGWLVAGLSGVVNATIAFDTTVHNTLWVVGHFHHMALLNIGLCIFGATYTFLPELTGKALYSERLARWHVWLTFGAGTVAFALWLVQGLEGAPRRYAVLPARFDSLTRAALPFVFVLALAQLLFAVNVLQTVRGKAGTVEEGAARAAARAAVPVVSAPWSRRLAPAVAEAAIVLVALGLAFAAGAVGWVVGREARPAATRTVTVTAQAATTAPPTRAGGDAEAGRAVFASAGCGGCHTLAAAGAHGSVGPNLDQVRPSEVRVRQMVTNGGAVMPRFAGRLSRRQIEDVAAFVAGAAGR